MELAKQSPNPFEMKPTTELLTTRNALLLTLNTAEGIIHSGSGSGLDYLALNESEHTLHTLQDELDKRGVRDE